MDTWLSQNYDQLPTEASLRYDDLRWIKAAAFAMDFDCHNNAAYYTELAAITRSIMAAPSGVHLNIHTDSKSSIEAIRRYMDEVNDRRKLRIAGRPFLELIQRMIETRSGQVQLHHVRSHTDLKDQHSSGNKVADFVAGSVLRKDEKGKRIPCPWLTRDTKSLPLQLGERHVVLKDHRQRVIAGDVRKTTQREAQARLIQKWKKSKSQSSFAGPYYKEIRETLFKAPSRQLMSHDSMQLLQQQRFLLQAACNTLQYRTCIVANKRVPYEEVCALCQAKRDTWHLFACPDLTSQREATATAIHAVLDQLWLDSHPTVLPKHTLPNYRTSLVCLVGWLMHRDLNNDQNELLLRSQPDVIRACFGGFLVWEMKAELRKFAGIGRDRDSDIDVKSQNPELFQKIDSLVESAIKHIRSILLHNAFAMSAS